MTDVVVIGKGPAGISAALYVRRGNLSVTVIGKDIGSLARAERIENYYGLPQPLTGRELAENGWQQAEALGVTLVTAEVVDIRWEDGAFAVATEAGDVYEARALVLATGAARRAPAIEGLAKFEGAGVSYCAICDGFFYRGRDVAVLGDGAFALHEVGDLLPVAASVTLLTHGKPTAVEFPPEVARIELPIQQLLGDERLTGARFADGTERAFDGLFVAVGTAEAASFARKLGLAMEGNRIVAGEDTATAIPGLFAAGDCTGGGGLLQVATAVAAGARAGVAAVSYVRNLDKAPKTP